jgi:hypothetical protein
VTPGQAALAPRLALEPEQAFQTPVLARRLAGAREGR